MNVPEETRGKLELYGYSHGGLFDIGSTEDGVRVAVKFHPHSFGLAWMFAEEVFHKSEIAVELRPSLIDRVFEPDNQHVVEMFYVDLKRYAEKQGGRSTGSRRRSPCSSCLPSPSDGANSTKQHAIGFWKVLRCWANERGAHVFWEAGRSVPWGCVDGSRE